MSSLEILSKNPNSAFSIITGLNEEIISYLKGVKKTPLNHLFLIVLKTKQDYKHISEVCSFLNYHTPITIQYQDTKKDSVRTLTDTALLFSSKNFTLDYASCSWFNPQHGRCTNLWDLTPNNDLYKCHEPVKLIKYGYLSFDVMIMMMQLSQPLPVMRWTYIGPKNQSVEKFSEGVLPCNIILK